LHHGGLRSVKASVDRASERAAPERCGAQPRAVRARGIGHASPGGWPRARAGWRVSRRPWWWSTRPLVVENISACRLVPHPDGRPRGARGRVRSTRGRRPASVV